MLSEVSQIRQSKPQSPMLFVILQNCVIYLSHPLPLPLAHSSALLLRHHFSVWTWPVRILLVDGVQRTQMSPPLVFGRAVTQSRPATIKKKFIIQIDNSSTEP